MSYQNYHRHSHVSNIIQADSVATNEDYCKRAVELGHTIISSCEHGTQGDYRECASLAEKYGLKWRYVTEAYFVKDRFDKDRTNCHMILAAKTEKGIGDLNEALSEANITGYYYRPRIDLDLLLKLDPRDVFVTTACVGGVFQYGYEDSEQLILLMKQHFRDSMMLEVQYHHTEKQKEINNFILGLYRKHGIPLIMGTDSHFIMPEESVLRDQRLEANHIKYDNEEGWFMDYPSDEVAYQRFVKQGVLSAAQIREAMDNTNVFLNFDEVELDKSKKLPTLYPSLSQDERNHKYTQLIYEKWDEYKANVPDEKHPIYMEGISHEVDTITSTNTSDYFLVDYNIVKRGKELGGSLTYTGRGSAPSFFTNTLLGFSSIDRFDLPVTMYPERFISADRILAGNLPDIDMNCGDVEPFAQAQAEVMGEWKSAPMIAFGTLKRASAWKMYCRAANVQFEIANSISVNLKQYDLDVKYADDDEKDDIDVFSYVPQEYHEYLNMSEKYLGMIDSISPHPCAYLLCQKDIRREIGVFRINSKTGKKKTVLAAFIDGATAEKYGYLKNDLLKVDVVKVNADVYKRIGIPQPTVSELLKLTDNDTATWDMYSKGYTMGLNQAEKEKSTEKVMRYKPCNITELSAFVAGIRPAFQSMINLLQDRKHFDYAIPALDRLLQTKEMPSSFILYQEQMMTVLQYAQFTAPESYSSIKAIAKKHPEKVLPLKERFLDGFKNRLIDEESVAEKMANETSDKVWIIISDACGYGFNSCLVGNTVIKRAHCGGGFVPTIEEMYRICNDKDYSIAVGHYDLHKKYARCGYGNALSLCEDGRVRENKLVNIYDQGLRDAFEVKLESGRTIVCTSNHKFPIGSHNNLIPLHDICVGDKLFVLGEYEHSKSRQCRYGKGIPTSFETIISIIPKGVQHVYDVEMKDPYHNFVIGNGIITGNSHAVAVALDSLYGAYAKAHYPYEYYTTLLTNYATKSDKDRIAKVRVEMRKAFGICVVPCKFRQDNRDYYIDKDNGNISDALTSVKHISKKVADALYDMRDGFYSSFVDLLYDLETHPVFDSTNVTVLIKMGYFREFGSAGKLLKLYQEFRNGENRFSKAHIVATQEKRLNALREFELTLQNEDMPMAEVMRFEIEHYGSPITECPNEHGKYAVIEVDDKYSPKIKLYNVSNGNVGLMKMRKPMFKQNPVSEGDQIDLTKWVRKPAYQYVDGKQMIKPGVFELWIQGYQIIS